jgi:ribosome-associated protein YbcJ (S4-like RNA binding protein)
VTVNGEPETRRGRRLRPGDAVQAGETELIVVSDAGEQAGGTSPTAYG